MFSPLKYLIWRIIGISVVYFGVVLLICEVLIYYAVLIKCSWSPVVYNDINPPLKAMILADTHLLGSSKGHWFDKLRREWQMYRAFQSAIEIHKPEVVFFLGDLFDEGLWCSKEEFDYYVKRFFSLFYVPENVHIHVVVGNHDIGFHYRINKYLKERFEAAFNSSSVQLLSIKGINFVLINSMAMEGDNCFLCKEAIQKLENVSNQLKCAQGIKPQKICKMYDTSIKYSRPVIMQHFPMYRESDILCKEPDAAPPEIISEPFRETWECLSRKASEEILQKLKPRIIFSGHTHHGCYRVHTDNIPEWTISSFSWRNKKNPSFLMLTIASDDYAVSKCYMPEETTVISAYIVFGVIWIILCTLSHKLLKLRDEKKFI